MANDDEIKKLYRRVASEGLATEKYLDHLDALEAQRQALPPGEEHDRVTADLFTKLADIVEQTDEANRVAHRTVESIKGSATPDLRGRYPTIVTYSDGSTETLYKTREELDAAKVTVQEEIAESKGPSPAVAAVLRAIDENINNAYRMAGELARAEQHELWGYVRKEDKEILLALVSRELTAAGERVLDASGIV